MWHWGTWFRAPASAACTGLKGTFQPDNSVILFHDLKLRFFCQNRGGPSECTFWNSISNCCFIIWAIICSRMFQSTCQFNFKLISNFKCKRMGLFLALFLFFLLFPNGKQLIIDSSQKEQTFSHLTHCYDCILRFKWMKMYLFQSPVKLTIISQAICDDWSGHKLDKTQ